MTRPAPRTWRALGLAAALMLGTTAPARAQYLMRRAPAATPAYAGSYPARENRGTYGPRMSFGAFGSRLNYGEAYGNPYGGMGSLNYGFGYGFGPGYPPGGAAIYSSAYNVPSPNPVNSGFYPPFAAYGTGWQNPAVFPSPGPNNGIAAPGSYTVPGRTR